MENVSKCHKMEQEVLLKLNFSNDDRHVQTDPLKSKKNLVDTDSHLVSQVHYNFYVLTSRTVRQAGS